VGLLTTPRTWSPGEIVTAAMLNTEIRDALVDVQEGWVAYTPTWIASTTNPAIGNGTITGAYRRIGKTIDARVKILAGSTTTWGSGHYKISLPVAQHAALATYAPVGFGSASYTSGTWRSLLAMLTNTASNFYLVRPATDVILDHSGPGTAWTATGMIQVALRYEAA